MMSNETYAPQHWSGQSRKQLNVDRVQHAIDKLNDIDIYPEIIGDKELRFDYNGSIIKFFPFTGWATGKTINDGRGIKNLLKQIQ